MMEDRVEYLTCACYSPEHTLRFTFMASQPGMPPELYAEVYLSHTLNFFQRIAYAVKYVFGFQSKIGAFDTFILRPDDASKLTDVLYDYVHDTNKFNGESNGAPPQCGQGSCKDCKCD